jgi:hypothetical protein
MADHLGESRLWVMLAHPAVLDGGLDGRSFKSEPYGPIAHSFGGNRGGRRTHEVVGSIRPADSTENGRWVTVDRPGKVEAHAMTKQGPARGHGPTRYDIVINGELGARFASAFSGMTIRAAEGQTHITGEVIDQSHMHGILDRIRDLGIELISVTPLVEEPKCPPSNEEPDSA